MSRNSPRAQGREAAWRAVRPLYAVAAGSCAWLSARSGTAWRASSWSCRYSSSARGSAAGALGQARAQATRARAQDEGDAQAAGRQCGRARAAARNAHIGGNCSAGEPVLSLRIGRRCGRIMSKLKAGVNGGSDRDRRGSSRGWRRRATAWTTTARPRTKRRALERARNYRAQDAGRHGRRMTKPHLRWRRASGEGGPTAEPWRRYGAQRGQGGRRRRRR